MARGYWILKSEPSDFSYDQLVREQTAPWDGVRNPQARNFIAKMKPRDLVFFYHSGKGPAIVGVARVTSPPRRDHTQAKGDDRWLLVDIEPVKPMVKAVPLALIKAQQMLADLLLVRQSRLSVIPLRRAQFRHILEMGDTPLRM